MMMKKESVIPKVFQFGDESGINANVLRMLTFWVR